MIDKRELEGAIAELENARDHSPQMCQRLADLYIIREKLFEPSAKTDYGYSLAAAPMPEPESLESYGDSEFLIAIQGKTPASAWTVMDELMDTLKAVNPRVYKKVLSKIRAL